VLFLCFYILYFLTVYFCVCTYMYRVLPLWCNNKWWFNYKQYIINVQVKIPSIQKINLHTMQFWHTLTCKQVQHTDLVYFATTDDNWSLILPSPSSIVSSVCWDSSTFTHSVAGILPVFDTASWTYIQYMPFHTSSSNSNSNSNCSSYNVKWAG